MVTDGFVTNKGMHSKQPSWTPHLLMCLNFPPWIRTKPGFLIVLGMVPPQCKSLQPFLGLFADQLDAMMDGLDVYDAYEEREVKCHSRLLVAINDLRALPKVSMATQAPSKYWACHCCNVLGINVPQLETQIYPGAIRLLDVCGSTRVRVRQLTREWRHHFRQAPEILAVATSTVMMRDAKSNQRAQIVAEQAYKISKACGKRATEAGGFLGYGMFNAHVMNIHIARLE